MTENLIPRARKMTKRAKDAKRMGANNARLVSLIVESIEAASLRGENFVKLKTKLHNSVVEELFKAKDYKIGPDFNSEGTDYFTISWPEE